MTKSKTVELRPTPEPVATGNAELALAPRWLICGCRTFQQPAVVNTRMNVLLAAHRTSGAPDPVIVHGAARGADTLGGAWGLRMGLVVEAYPADWGTHDRAAGPIRNQQMLDSGIDFGVAFYDRPFWASAGTSDMVRKLTNAGVPGVMYFGVQAPHRTYDKRLVARRNAFLATPSGVAG